MPNGNFLTEDSYLGNITDPLTLNRYNYVKSSPLNYIDPSGHETWEETLERYMRDTPIEFQQLSGSEIEALGTLYHDDWAARYSNATSDRERWGLVFEAKTVLRTNKILSEAYRTVSDLLEQGMTAAEISSYLQECGQENDILKALSNVNWAKVGTGLLQTVRAAIVISVGIAAIAASGPAACAAIIGLLNGAGISALGLNAIGVTLAGSMVATMGYADATQAYGNIYYGFLGSDDEVAHIIIDNIEFLRNDPELYYLFEAMATLGTAEATRMFEINYGIYLSNRESNILEKASYKNKGESNTQVSQNKLKHINNRHNPNSYAQQIKNRPEADVLKELENKSFFNKDWSKAQIEEAVNAGYKEALEKGISSGQYKFSYGGENVTIALENGGIKTAFGDYKYTYQQLLELLK